ncbi:MAG: hypothetical protein BWK76_01120 [Desulfobulbaceae bacterium A2]|nr:MAG: hypothetical protein BWK76_01120 [Desulfobulbaceae bacterium A2]
MSTKPSQIAPARGERLIAGLALATAPGSPMGTCLAAEQLAALVDDRLTAGERQAALAHLAECEYCYAAWREVTVAAKKSETQRGVLLRLLRPRNLASIGSALALAASVMVFVQLRHSGVPQPGLPVPSSAPELRVQEGSAERLNMQSPEPQRLDAASSVPPAAAPAVPAEQVPLAAPTQSRRRDAEESQGAGKAKSTTPPLPTEQLAPVVPRQPSTRAVEPPQADRRAKEAVEAPAAAPAAMPVGDSGMQGELAPPAPKRAPAQAAPPALPDVDKGAFLARQATVPAATAEALAWQRQVAEQCWQPLEDVQHWTRLHEAGQALLARQPPGESRQRQEAFLAALAKMHSTADIEASCEVIRRLGSEVEVSP